MSKRIEYLKTENDLRVWFDGKFSHQDWKIEGLYPQPISPKYWNRNLQLLSRDELRKQKHDVDKRNEIRRGSDKFRRESSKTGINSRALSLTRAPVSTRNFRPNMTYRTSAGRKAIQSSEIGLVSNDVKRSIPSIDEVVQQHPESYYVVSFNQDSIPRN